MKKSWFLVLIALLLIAGTMTVYAQDNAGYTVVPAPSNFGSLKVHTHLFYVIPQNKDGINPAIPGGENPASLACIYGAVPPTTGCPLTGTIVPTGGAKAVAVVDYGTYPGLQSDLNAYSAQWGLPPVTITTVCYPAPPCVNDTGSGWDTEEALDVEMAHALAPNAAIYVAAFSSDPLGDNAEQGIASLLATTYGGGEVSNSWTYNGGEAWCSPPANCELSYDSDFAEPGIVYTAAAGDAGAQVNYPCVSPNVVCSGGTRILRTAGLFTGEACSSISGGGISTVEPSPSYQYVIRQAFRSFRGIPDMAADADPSSGVAIYLHGSWGEVAGTSVATPILAGYFNLAGNFLADSNAELTKAYNWYNFTPFSYHTYFRDETSGSNGHPAGTGWDECTGLGSPIKVSGF